MGAVPRAPRAPAVATLAGSEAARLDACAEVATLLPPVEAVDALPPESLPGFVAGLAALQARAAARLVVRMPAPTAHDRSEDDMIADVREVARIVRHSVSWVRKSGHTLPGFRQPGGRGTRVAWWR